MGYTHYLCQSKKLKLTSKQHALIDQILTDHASILDVTQNDTKGLDFNGIGDNAHENACFIYGKLEGLSFTKTARKPYDIAVCKVWLVLSLSSGVTISSDGDMDGSEWREAKEWFALRA
jgi:hypothetical protein